MPAMCEMYGIKPWEYWDVLSYLDWRDLKNHIDAVNEAARSRR